MYPSVWGPTMWKLLFNIAMRATDDSMEDVRHFLFHVLPYVIPCHECRLHFRLHRAKVNKRAGGEPKSAEHMFRWLYYLKDEVNKNVTKQRSPPLQEVYAHHNRHFQFQKGWMTNDVELADMLVLVAIEAHDNDRDDDCIAFVQSIRRFAKLPYELDTELAEFRRPIVPKAMNVAKHVRAAHALPVHTVKQYSEWGGII